MIAHEFQALLDADPLEPFTLTFTGGSVCTVADPEQAWVTPHGCGEVRYPDGGGAIMPLDHVTAVDFVAPTAVVQHPRSA